jgi:hypothetical protein
MEIWKDVKGYEGLYQVSDLGKIRSLDRLKKGKNNSLSKIKGKLLKPRIDKGYYIISLSKDGKKKTFLLHRIVAINFIDNPFLKKTVNHINGIKIDNKLENLEWCTYSENNIHAHNIGLKNQVGEKNNASKMTADIVYKIKFETDGMKYKDIAKIYNIHESYVGLIKRNERWKHIIKKFSS